MSDDQCHQSPAIESYITFSTDNVKYLNFYKNTFPDDGSYHLFKIGRLGMVRIIRATMGVDLRGNTGDTVNMHI